MQAAHAQGMRVCSHARSDESILQCLQYGVDIIYHASFISDATMSALETQKERVFVAPALNFPAATLKDAEAFGCEYISLCQINLHISYRKINRSCRQSRSSWIRSRTRHRCRWTKRDAQEGHQGESFEFMICSDLTLNC